MLLTALLSTYPSDVRAVETFAKPVTEENIKNMLRATQKVGKGAKLIPSNNSNLWLLLLDDKIHQLEMKKTNKTTIKADVHGFSVELIKQFEGNFHIKCYQTGISETHPDIYLNVRKTSDGFFVLSPLNESTYKMVRDFPTIFNGENFRVNTTHLETNRKAMGKDSSIMGLDEELILYIALGLLMTTLIGGAAWKYLDLQEQKEIEAANEKMQIKIRAEAKARVEAEAEAKNKTQGRQVKLPFPPLQI